MIKISSNSGIKDKKYQKLCFAHSPVLSVTDYVRICEQFKGKTWHLLFFLLTAKSENAPKKLITQNTFVEQAWQELIMLRHVKGQKHISSPKLIASWIDQAHIYYSDSTHSDWRSAGLLYYYSFLNLANVRS